MMSLDCAIEPRTGDNSPHATGRVPASPGSRAREPMRNFQEHVNFIWSVADELLSDADLERLERNFLEMLREVVL